MQHRRLITIPISHYCEKARWALERAGLDYAEERHVQGIHRIVAKRTGGGTTVPVLVAPEGVFTESEQILRYADERVGDDARLFPLEPGLRREVEALSRDLDERFGPAGRRLMYVHMFEQRKLMLSVNNQGVPAWEGVAMRALWPLAVRGASRLLDIGPDTKRKDEPVVQEVFDQIAARLAEGGPYLFGDRFTAADLTFAALSASVVVPPDYGVPLPQPDVLATETAEVVLRLREHPAGAYAMALFETHRRARAGSHG